MPLKPGLRFGLLTVLDRAPRRGKHSAAQWLCQCDCGTVMQARSDNLKRGNTGSCGCQSSRAMIGSRSRKHGHYHGHRPTLTWNSWAAMRRRCLDPRTVNYHRYGGSGVTVCDRWRNDFQAFLADMGERPAPDYTLDRIDGGKSYEPGNCRWASKTEQSRNLSSNRLIFFHGETRCLAEWAELYGLLPETIANRIDHLGWTVEDALTTPTFGEDMEATGDPDTDLDALEL